MQLDTLWATTGPFVAAVAIKIAGAIVLYMVGRWLIGFAIRLLNIALTRRNFDATLQRYIANILAVTLNIILVIGILGYFGVQTTSFAALLAGVGLAIGAAWSGLLGNFAAGAFLIMFRPFKVGDFITAGGVTGTVTAIGLFNTIMTTPDNLEAIIGNGKISNDVITNFSTHGYRRVERTAQLAFGVDPLDAIARLKPALASIPNVLATPAPDVEILDFNALGTQLAVRPYCNNNDYWQVFFDTNKLIAETFGNAGYAAPHTRIGVAMDAVEAPPPKPRKAAAA